METSSSTNGKDQEEIMIKKNLKIQLKLYKTTMFEDIQTLGKVCCMCLHEVHHYLLKHI